MNGVWSLLIEFAVLLFFGLLFYLFQRRKIIRNDRINIYETLKKISEEIKKSSANLNIQNYAQKLDEFNESNDYTSLYEQMQCYPSELDTEYQEQLRDFQERVQFYLGKK